jgi:hypothetical protein
MSDDDDGEEYPCDDDDEGVATDYGEEMLSDEENDHDHDTDPEHKKEAVVEVQYKPICTRKRIAETIDPTPSRAAALLSGTVTATVSVDTECEEFLKHVPKRAKCRKVTEVTTRKVSFATVISSTSAPVDAPPIPNKCPILKVPYPQTLLQAEAAYQATLPDPKFMKRMKITNEKCSLMSFVVHKINNENVTPATASVALTLEEKDSIYDEHVCEQCNEVKILDSRTAQSVCLSCGESSTYMVPDTSYREGVSLHTPYRKYHHHFMHHKHRLQLNSLTY